MGKAAAKILGLRLNRSKVPILPMGSPQVNPVMVNIGCAEQFIKQIQDQAHGRGGRTFAVKSEDPFSIRVFGTIQPGPPIIFRTMGKNDYGGEILPVRRVRKEACAMNKLFFVIPAPFTGIMKKQQ
jgi:hypothetical protein